MREILFRGKRIGGKWVEGLISKPHVRGENGKVIIYYFSILDEGLFTSECSVRAETVCQYTGLTDKNGRKIFEGDIINDIDYGIMKCIYLHGSFVWYKEDGFKIECMRYVPVIEVIGNIFDNPELI